MKLWEKNYLLTYGLFLAVLYASMAAVLLLSFQNDIDRGIETAVSGEQGIIALIRQAAKQERADRQIAELAEIYSNADVYMRILRDDMPVVDTAEGEDLPYPEAEDMGRVRIIKVGERSFFAIRDSEQMDESSIELQYWKEITLLYRMQWRRGLLMSGFCIFLSVFIGTLLYISMKRIYKPIHNISHELRTPLTGIQGYAQYLQIGNISEEDRQFAVEQIVQDAEHMKNIMEKLLIMGAVRDGGIHQRKIELPGLMEKYSGLYPGLEAECTAESVTGDESLLCSLLNNLLNNAFREGIHVKMTVTQRQITIWNDGAVIPQSLLKKLNRGQELSDEEIKRNGYGVRLCHDIAKIHGWKLTFISDERNGTSAIVDLNTIK